MKINRYLVMAFELYYPHGGRSEIVGLYETIPDAEEALQNELEKPYLEAGAQIIDLADMSVVFDTRADDKN